MRRFATLTMLAASLGCRPDRAGGSPGQGPLAEFARSVEWDYASCVQISQPIVVENRTVTRICTGHSNGGLGYITLGPGDTVLSVSLEWRPGPLHLDSVATLAAMRLASGFPGAETCRKQRASTLYSLKAHGYIVTLDVDSIQGRVGEFRTLGSLAACGVLADSSETPAR